MTTCFITRHPSALDWAKDGDGFHEVHVNTMEGAWSLLRTWLRPHRGISQEKLLLYIDFFQGFFQDFFQFVHNARLRGIGLLQPLLGVLLTAAVRNP